MSSPWSTRCRHSILLSFGTALLLLGITMFSVTADSLSNVDHEVMVTLPQLPQGADHYRIMVSHGSETMSMNGETYTYYTNDNQFIITVDPDEIYTVNLQAMNSRGQMSSLSEPLVFSYGDIIERTAASTGTELPVSYSLAQNSPNPFNPTTTISYTMARPGEVRLVVYNIAGQKVATLLDSYREAGDHSVVWNGAGMPSGTYFYKISCEDFSETRKMMLVK